MSDLADDELEERLVQHGVPREAARWLVTYRDSTASRIEIRRVLGTRLTFIFVQDATGGRAVTWGSEFADLVTLGTTAWATRVPVAGTDDSVPVVLPNQVRVLDESGEPCGMATLHEVNGVEALYVCPVHIGGRFASGRWSFEDGRGRLIEVQLMNAPGFHVAEGS